MKTKKPKYQTREAKTLIEKINILPQMRKTFEEIEDLALDILEKGLIHPVTIAQLSSTEAKKYVRYVSQVFKEKIDFESLVAYRGKYLILIAGERRVRACKLLQRDLYKNRFGSTGIRSTICVGISPKEAIKLQGSENKRNPVPPHEEADFLDKYFRMLRKVESSLTACEFSRTVGRSQEAVKAALRFSKLPQFVRKAVSDSIVPFGVACELGRLYESGVKGKELKDWFVRCVVNDFRVKEFKEIVQKYLLEKKSIQINLLQDIFSKIEEDEAKHAARKRSIERKTSEAFYHSVNYMLRVLYLFENGFMGLEDSPFAMGGPKHAFKQLLELQKKILPHLRGVRKLSESGKLIRKLESELSKIK